MPIRGYAEHLCSAGGRGGVQLPKWISWRRPTRRGAARGGLESAVCALHIGYDPASAEPFRFYVDQQESTTWTPGAKCMSYRNCVDTICTAWIAQTRVYHSIGRPLSCLTVMYRDGDDACHCELRDVTSVLAAERRGILRRSTFMCR